MPIHPWHKVRSNRFHDFHQSWTVEIRNALNRNLPEGYFAMVEQKTSGPEPDVVTLELNAPGGNPEGGVAVAVAPPRAKVVARESAGYAQKANRVVVRYPDGQVVAVIEIVSPGNKDSRHALDAFTGKAAEFLRAGIHLLIVDLFPPSHRDPQGFHPLIWEHFCEEPFELPADKPLTLAAYHVGYEVVAYIEPVAVGDPLPDMPVFLSRERYVNCALEASYMTAWEQYPAPLKAALA